MATAKGKNIALGLSADAEVTSTDYIGDLPPARKALPGALRRAYLAATEKGDPILKVLYEVTEGPFAGFTAWDNVTLINGAAFKWKPLADALGITYADFAGKGLTVDENDNSGAGNRVLTVGGKTLPDAGTPVFFGVTYRTWQGSQQIEVAGVRYRKVTPDNGPF